ncbi:MAG: BMC domain-containing protein [Veillonella sp.]|nr:BMC domain-containing protein [Veillonella sp.]
MKEALGLVEVRGLASAIHVADVMVKAANVHIIGLEKARGSGWMTVKVSGDVGAVQASVEAGAAEGLALQALISKLVIPRPADGLDKMLKPEPVITPLTKETPAPKSEEPKLEEPKAEEPKAEATKAEASVSEPVAPAIEAATVEPPKSEEPKPEPPKVEAEAPKAEAPKVEAPKATRPVRKRAKSTKVAKTTK